jgi:ATP-binding cassette subfamily E protein 1
MDEPSAYLDVEQRLVISSIIKDFIEKKGASCMVVDHDLLFIDYLSENLIVLKGIPAIKGKVMGPYEMEEGMNLFLKDLNITFRRDPESYRPRANKPDSQMDRKQKSEGKLYYIS